MFVFNSIIYSLPPVVTSVAGAVAAVAAIVICRESFTVTPYAHPHLMQLGCMSRPRFVTVTDVGRLEYPWKATTKVSVKTCVCAPQHPVGTTTDIVAVTGMKIVVPTSLGVPFLYVKVVCGCTVESTQYPLHLSLIHI